MRVKTLILLSIIFILLNSCKIHNVRSKNNLQTFSDIRLIGEKIIPNATIFDNTVVGGLSSIDYYNGIYYAISDDKKKPVRFYEMKIEYNQKGIDKYEITNVTSINTNEKYIDPEALRYDKTTGNFFWTSEGALKKGVSPSIFEIDNMGKSIRTLQTPKIFVVDDNRKTGPRRNGTFEALSLSVDGKSLWVGMELPLKQDGEEPKLKDGKYPVRITKINKETGKVEFQFAYMLDRIPRDSRPSGMFTVNGLPEILALGENRFLFIERAYASGHKDGGNTIKIFLVDANKATDIKNINSLIDTEYNPATKKLLFDFDSVRDRLTKGVIDNIEGITFGKKLKNGHKTLVLVSDNNFSKFGSQLNQIIVLEYMSK